jgi:23S rRNA (uracil1939-C5)-methyltransferase
MLAERVIEIVEGSKPEYFIDFFCGVGLFAIAAGLHGAKQVLGVERQSMAVRAARQNTKAAGVWAEFIAADAEDIAEDALGKIDCGEAMVIVDPPREGLEKDLVSVLIDKKPKDLIYVSCSPDTLARDLKLLTADAYDVVDCQMIDMFPRTKHFESVTHLRLK